MDGHGVRYSFEHRLLPHCFFEEKERFIGMLLNDKSFLYRIISDIFDKEGVPNPYKLEDFQIDISKLAEDVLGMKIVFPAPEKEPLCHYAYMFFNSDFTKTSYFCIEKGSDTDNNNPFVCEWTPDGNHVNYGGCTLEEQGDYLRCIEIHLRNYYGTTAEKKDN